jgi:hypothetical protein
MSQNIEYMLSIIIWKMVANLVEHHSICDTKLCEWCDKT